MAGMLKSVKRKWEEILSTYIITKTDTLAVKYEAFRRQFLWQRLRLWLCLLLICVLTFILRDIYDNFFPLNEFQDLPKVLKKQGYVINISLVFSVILCLTLHKNSFWSSSSWVVVSMHILVNKYSTTNFRNYLRFCAT